jgi:amidophosphoribosyltransferase
VTGVADAASFVALGLHALQHRGQEAGGIVTHDPEHGLQLRPPLRPMCATTSPARSVMETLPGEIGIGHVRYSTAGSKGATQIRDVQPFFGEFAMGGAAIAHNGNITNADELRRELIERGSIFQSSSDSECIIHLMARSAAENHPRADEGRAAPGRRRVFHRRDDPHQADRRARSAGRAPAGAGPDRR